MGPIYNCGVSFLNYIAAAEVGGLRGALTAIGTLAFVGLCFLAVVMVDRRGGAAAAPTVAVPGGAGGSPSVSRSSASATVSGTAAGSLRTDSVVGPGEPGGATGFDSDVPADDVWPLRRSETVSATQRGLPGHTQSVVTSVGGALAAVAVAIALIPLRDEVGLSSVALALVLVVVAAAALGGRVAAAITSAAAALAFNFLHATPLYSFHIAGTADVISSVLMIVVGISVGEVAVRSFRTRADGRSSRLT